MVYAHAQVGPHPLHHHLHLLHLLQHHHHHLHHHHHWCGISLGNSLKLKTEKIRGKITRQQMLNISYTSTARPTTTAATTRHHHNQEHPPLQTQPQQQQPPPIAEPTCA